MEELNEPPLLFECEGVYSFHISMQNVCISGKSKLREVSNKSECRDPWIEVYPRVRPTGPGRPSTMTFMGSLFFH